MNQVMDAKKEFHGQNQSLSDRETSDAGRSPSVNTSAFAQQPPMSPATMAGSRSVSYTGDSTETSYSAATRNSQSQESKTVTSTASGILTAATTDTRPGETFEKVTASVVHHTCLRHHVKALEDEIRRQAEELKDVKMKMADMNTKKTALEKFVKDQRKVIEDQKEQLRSEAKKENDLVKKNDQLRRHNYELQQRIKQLEKDKKDNEIKHAREINQLRLENEQVVKAQKIMDERKIKSHKRQKTWQSTGVIQGRKPVGLRNLGNSCYFNAVMQNIYQTILLQNSLDRLNCLNRSTLEPEATPISTQLVIILEDMQDSPEPSTFGRIFSQGFDPSALFNEFCRRSLRFSGGRQQDSYEVLRHLMDGVKEEHRQLKQRWKGEKQSETMTDSASGETVDDTRLTVVDSVFGGHFLSVFHCKSCNTPYHLFEPCLDISLPILFQDEDNTTALAATKSPKTAESLGTPSQPAASQPACNNKQQASSDGWEKVKGKEKNKKTSQQRFDRNEDKEDDIKDDNSNDNGKPGERDVESSVHSRNEPPEEQHDSESWASSETSAGSNNNDTEGRETETQKETSGDEDMSVDETESHGELEPGDSGPGDATSSVPESVGATQKQGPGNNGETGNAEETGDEQGEMSSSDTDGATTAQADNTGASNTSEDTGNISDPMTQDSLYKQATDTVMKRLEAIPVRLDDNSIPDSLRFYTRQEQLDEYLCLTCNQGKVDFTLQRATKQTLIFNPPAVLTIHLKRFEQTSRGYVKVSRYIKFDEFLDLSPYCSRFAWRQQPDCKGSFVYRLYGVVVHSGSLKGGHYTACVRLRNVHLNSATAFLQKTFLDREKMMSKEQLIELVAEDLPRQRLTYLTNYQPGDAEDEWFDISDTSVSPISREQVYNKEAYLLFYDRIF